MDKERIDVGKDWIDIDVVRILKRCWNLMTPGIIMIDQAGRARFVSQAARAILAERDGIRWSEDSVSLADPADQRRLDELVEAAHNGPASEVRAMLVQRPSALLSYQLTVVPGGLASDLVALLLSDPCASPVGLHTQLRELYGLTKAEAGVAVALAGGSDLHQIAARSKRSVETVRSHLRRVFDKTGTTRQVDLVRVIVGGGASRGA